MTLSPFIAGPILRGVEGRPIVVASVLFFASAVLHLAGIGFEPLRDWDEGTVAQVAREIAERGWAGFWQPTLWGEPYVNKPPLVHGLMALSMRTFGESEWAIRLAPALLSSASVPALYIFARDLFGRTRPAFWSAVVLLTLLPVARHGRLAMLDGPLVLFGLLFLLCLGRARQGRGWAFGAGLALSGAALTKGAAAGVFILIGVGWILLTKPRLLVCVRLWLLGTLGLLPALLWYAVQIWRGGVAYAEATLTNQVLVRIGVEEAEISGPLHYYLIEVLEGGWPWILFLPAGLFLGWRERRELWFALAMPWFLGHLLLISALPSKLPWYIHPAFPAFALICGRGVEALLEGPLLPRPAWVLRGLWLPALAAVAGTALFSPIGIDPNMMLSLGSFAFALSLGWAAWRLRSSDVRIPAALAVGAFLALLFLALSGRAVWELSEDYSVLPVAEAIVTHVPPGAVVLTTQVHSRPSLNFYAKRPIRPASFESLLAGAAAETYWLATPEEAQQVLNREWLDEAGDRILLGPAGP
jgi:4-amino-4-deoxy-L-arabinose transferase-like glycosyltransferase